MPDCRNARARVPLYNLLAASLTVGLAACGDGSSPGPLPADSTIVAPVIVTDTAPTRAVADTAPEPLQDSVVSVEGQLSALREAVATLQRSTDSLLARGIPAGTDSAAADTAAVLPQALVRETAQNARNVGARIVAALLVILLTVLLVRTAVWLLDALAERSARQRLLFKKLIPIARIAVWTIATYLIVANIFHVDRNGLLAGTAALGVGIGFAAQGILKNLFGGLIIIFDQPFQVGDKINIGGTYGEVVSIGLRATRLVTPDDNLVSVPNGQVVEGQVANANAGALDCQVVVDLYLPGWIDVTKAKAIAYDAAVNSKFVFLEKPVVVNVKDIFRETFLTHLVVKAYVIDTRFEFALASDVTEAAKMEFRRHGMLRPSWGVHGRLEPADDEPGRQPWESR